MIRRDQEEKGVSLLLTAVLLFSMLAMAALAIDGVILYLARSEAQRAADAAALAGAQALVDSGYMSGGVTATTAQTYARQRAEAVGTMNLIGRQAPSITDGDVTFDFSRPGDPLVTVVAQRSTARGNALPTFFARLWGYGTANVKATATAEAFNPSGTGVSATGSCLKPWVLPNCDPNPLHQNPPNPNCPGSGTFISSDGSITHPGPVSAGGVLGEVVTLKPGAPSDAPAPSQYYPIQIPLSPDPLCPACAQVTGGGGNTGAAVYRENIECCNSNHFVCGDNPNLDLSLQTGNIQGPTKSGVACLINEGQNELGQDTISLPTTPPPVYSITAGPNYPLASYAGQTILPGQSSSVVTMPVYDGHTLCPGGSCETTVSIIGFMQVFINSVTLHGGQTQGYVTATILNIAGCGSTGGGGGGGNGGGSNGGPTGAAGSPIPVRLVHP